MVRSLSTTAALAAALLLAPASTRAGEPALAAGLSAPTPAGAPGLLASMGLPGAGATLRLAEGASSDRRSPLEIIALDTLFGAGAGFLIGGAIALIAQNDDWDRQIMIGTGIGVIGGALFGAIRAYRSEAGISQAPSDRGRDGLGTLARGSPLEPKRTFALAARF